MGDEKRRGKTGWRERGDDCMKREKKEKTTAMSPVIHPPVLFHRSDYLVHAACRSI